MKKSITLILIILFQLSFAQTKLFIETPRVDEKVELLSIVFRLAGNKEYNSTYFKKYTDEVESHFNAYKKHALIKFAKELHEKKDISYEAVMNMAIFLDYNLNPIIDFATTVPERWDKYDAIKFVGLLKKFYKDTRCKKFFRENEELFKEVSNRFGSIYKSLDLNWFQSFYGEKSNENFNLIISPGCGDNSYGTSYTLPNSRKEVFAIMGTWKIDENGMPDYEKDDYFPIILHEFNHSFVNQLLINYKQSFEESGKEIYKSVEYEMSRQQAYGNWQIMLNEALVRASVIKYFIDHNSSESKIQMMLNNESNIGFIWIRGLVGELKKYDDQRNTYPTLDSYIPALSNAYKSFAEKISQFDVQRPKVKSITEFTNNDRNVSPQIKTITINFDKPLAGEGYSIDYGSKGKFTFPKFDSINYINDNQSVVIEVQLTPDKEYQMILNGRNFKTKKGFGLKTYEVNFKTEKK